MKRLSIPNQDDVCDQFDRLAQDATRLESIAGNTAPARPKLTNDLFRDAEALESHVALLQVRARLQATPPRAVVVTPSANQPATKAPAVVSPATGAKLTATQRALAAKAATLKPAPKPVALIQPAPLALLSATERCLAAKAPKIKPIAPALPAKGFVPMPSQFSDPAAALRAAQNECINSEITLQYHRKPFKRHALTGDNAADVATLAAYRDALTASVLSLPKK